MKPFVTIAFVSTALSLSSCGWKDSMASLKDKITPDFKAPKLSVPKMPEVKKGDIARFSFRDLLPSSVPVVEVRESDLKEIQSGKDKAMAYQNSNRNYFSSFFGGSADFKEPALPMGGMDNPEFGLLPPKPQ